MSSKRWVSPEKEFEIVRLLMEGVPYKEIAIKTKTSRQTVAMIFRRWPLFFWRRLRVQNYILNRKPVQRRKPPELRG